MKSIVTKFKGESVKAIALTTSPAQTASAATNNAGLGLNVPMIGNSPVFAPALLDTPAAAALSKLYVVASAVPYDSPGAPRPRSSRRSSRPRTRTSSRASPCSTATPRA